MLHDNGRACEASLAAGFVYSLTHFLCRAPVSLPSHPPPSQALESTTQGKEGSHTNAAGRDAPLREEPDAGRTLPSLPMDTCHYFPPASRTRWRRYLRPWREVLSHASSSPVQLRPHWLHLCSCDIASPSQAAATS
ncbi:hypothetical protein E2C01_003722 [Portunus trituberculatus]|uniref:Uncharacterized protein n=1 Tax=Portunus trituberculatus TaxID=210409 RepID=A0A5B7CNR1_PORTR|nr:hypothetical protein [Portunus trituberculatus]